MMFLESNSNYIYHQRIFIMSLPTLKKVVLFGLITMVSLIATAQEKQVTQSVTNPFAKLVGEWSIRDYTLTKTGEWQELNGADWNFYWILDGAAIQDDWIAPSLSKPAPEAGRQLGTNIRIFNPKTSEWEMAWISNGGKKLENFSAKNVDDTVVMSGDYQGVPTRITFYDIRKAQFSWKMERPKKDAKGEYTSDWRTIYKIEGTRKK
jgi:hypothetical protein